MIVQRGIETSSAGRGGFFSIGNFDGVHRGHQRILGSLVHQARAAGVTSVAMTFDPHPITLLAPHRAPPNLTTRDRKAELIAQCGVERLIVLETSAALLQLSPQEFFSTVIRERLAARGLVEGPNFCFGRDRQGDVGTLREYCATAGMSLQVVEPVEQAGVVVSSSAIRKAIASGNVAAAVAMLGHPFQMSGKVVAGAQRGRQIGFPTANLSEIATLLPADGVYAGFVRRSSDCIPAAVHIGPNPTFGDQVRKVEVHLIGQAVELYGQVLAVELLSEVRGTRTFASRELLVRQLDADLAEVQRIVGEYSSGAG